MNANERYFRKTIGAVGGSLLLFWGFLQLYGVALVLLSSVLSALPFSAPTNNVIYYVIYGAGYLFCFMAPVALLKLLIRANRYPYQPMETRISVSPLWLLMIPAGITLVFAAARINVVLTDVFDPPSVMDSLTEASYGSMPAYLWVLQFMTICAVPGFCEEFFFRGAILSNCLPFGRSNAILISALIFSLMHQNPAQTFYAFAAGIALGVLYERTHSIWPGTILHMLNNFASVGESMIPYKYWNSIRSSIGFLIFEIFLFAFGAVALMILIRRCFSKREEYADGVFGKTASSLAIEAAYPILPKRAIQLFLHPTMLVFLILCVLQILFLMLINGVL